MASHFISSSTDSFLFIKHQDKETLILLLCVDDMIVTGNSSTMLTYFLQQEFVMNHLGLVHYF